MPYYCDHANRTQLAWPTIVRT